MTARIYLAGTAAAFAILLGACQNMPEPYAPPVQRQPFENFRPYRVARIVEMSDPYASPHIVQDISDAIEAGTWRWTAQRPTVRVTLKQVENLKYVIDFTVPEATLKVTGPVTVSFTVNGRVLDRMRYATPGAQHFEKAVPADWVEANHDALVGAEIDKVWVAPQDKRTLGFILMRIGLTQ